MTKDLMKDLAQELLEASQAYYQEGESHLTDHEFDAKLLALRAYAEENPGDFPEDSPYHALIAESAPGLGSSPTGKDLVQHQTPMLSLSKVNDEAGLGKWLEKMTSAGAESFKIQGKFDGSAVSLVYRDGQLDTVASRGDGWQGTNYSWVKTSTELTVEGLPLITSMTGVVEVRGEMFFTNDQFKAISLNREKAIGTAFSNPRNAISGILNKGKKGLGYTGEATFTAYSLFQDGVPVDLAELPEGDGFLSADTMTARLAPMVILSALMETDVPTALAQFGFMRSTGFSEFTDGAVVKPQLEGKLYRDLGDNGHHPLSQVAYKFEEPQALTTIRAIHHRTGKTGRVNPVASFDQVDLGTNISEATLNNYRWASEKGAGIGAQVMVEKANGVIPKIAVVITPGSGLAVPEKCPSCGTELDVDLADLPTELICPNSEECPAQLFLRLLHAISKGLLNVDQMSGALLSALMDSGQVRDLGDLFTLSEEALASTEFVSSDGERKLGPKRAKHIYSYMQEAKNKPLHIVLASLAIPKVGRRLMEKVVASAGNLEAVLETDVNTLASIEGIGPKTAERIVDGLQRNRALLEKLVACGFTMEPVEAVAPVVTDDSISGLSFAITGLVPTGFANRGDFVAHLESRGASFHSAPKKNTSYVIGDTSSSSSKMKKALSMGLEVISPDEWTQRFSA